MSSDEEEEFEFDEPELDEAFKLLPPNAVVQLECAGHRATMLGGHSGELNSINVRVEERDVKMVNGDRVTQLALNAWALDICLKVPEGSMGEAEEEAHVMQEVKVVQQADTKLKVPQSLKQFCALVAQHYEAATLVGKQVWVLWYGQLHNEQKKVKDKGKTWVPVALSPKGSRTPSGVWYCATVKSFNPADSRLTVEYHYNRAEPELGCILMPFTLTHFGETVPPGPGDRCMQLRPPRPGCDQPSEPRASSPTQGQTKPPREQQQWQQPAAGADSQGAASEPRIRKRTVYGANPNSLPQGAEPPGLSAAAAAVTVPAGAGAPTSAIVTASTDVAKEQRSAKRQKLLEDQPGGTADAAPAQMRTLLFAYKTSAEPTAATMSMGPPTSATGLTAQSSTQLQQQRDPHLSKMTGDVTKVQAPRPAAVDNDQPPPATGSSGQVASRAPAASSAEPQVVPAPSVKRPLDSQPRHRLGGTKPVPGRPQAGQVSSATAPGQTTAAHAVLLGKLPPAAGRAAASGQTQTHGTAGADSLSGPPLKRQRAASPIDTPQAHALTPAPVPVPLQPSAPQASASAAVPPPSSLPALTRIPPLAQPPASCPASTDGQQPSSTSASAHAQQTQHPDPAGAPGALCAADGKAASNGSDTLSTDAPDAPNVLEAFVRSPTKSRAAVPKNWSAKAVESWSAEALESWPSPDYDDPDAVGTPPMGEDGVTQKDNGVAGRVTGQDAGNAAAEASNQVPEVHTSWPSPDYDYGADEDAQGSAFGSMDAALWDGALNAADKQVLASGDGGWLEMAVHALANGFKHQAATFKRLHEAQRQSSATAMDLQPTA